MVEGTYLKYVDKKFSPDSLSVIHAANDIIGEYESQGYTLTLRQLYYQFVARALLANKQENYNRLGNIISDARLAGMVSWTSIEDRTRNLQGLQHFDSPADIIETAKLSYRRDLWSDQDWRPEVWIEKEALVGVIQGICNNLRVDFFACRGYNSQSEQWRAGQRFARRIRKGQRPIIFHLGDHDPSGLDMTRDNHERLSMFAGVPVQVVRLALNYSQVEEFKPPPNPTKMSDSRAEGYIKQFGYSSWELDALDPRKISDLIGDSIIHLRDEERWYRSLAEEDEERALLQGVEDKFRNRNQDEEDED